MSGYTPIVSNAALTPYMIVSVERGEVPENVSENFQARDAHGRVAWLEGDLQTLNALILKECKSQHMDPEKITVQIESDGFVYSFWKMFCNAVTCGCYSGFYEDRCYEMRAEKFRATFMCEGRTPVSKRGSLIDQLARSILGRQGSLKERCHNSLYDPDNPKYDAIRFECEKIESSHQK